MTRNGKSIILTLKGEERSSFDCWSTSLIQKELSKSRFANNSRKMIVSREKLHRRTINLTTNSIMQL